MVRMSIAVGGLDRAKLLASIFNSPFGMNPKIVPKSEVADDLRRTCLEEMCVHRNAANPPADAEATTFNPILAQPFVAKRLQTAATFIEPIHTVDDRKKIDDGPCDQSRDCRRTYMMNCGDAVSELPQIQGENIGKRRPGWIILANAERPPGVHRS